MIDDKRNPSVTGDLQEVVGWHVRQVDAVPSSRDYRGEPFITVDSDGDRAEGEDHSKRQFYFSERDAVLAFWYRLWYRMVKKNAQMGGKFNQINWRERPYLVEHMGTFWVRCRLSFSFEVCGDQYDDRVAMYNSRVTKENAA